MYPYGLLPEMLLRMIREENERIQYELQILGQVRRKQRKHLFSQFVSRVRGKRMVENRQTIPRNLPNTSYVDCTRSLTPCS